MADSNTAREHGDDRLRAVETGTHGVYQLPWYFLSVFLACRGEISRGSPYVDGATQVGPCWLQRWQAD
jgi:hypothetical protein